MLGEILEINQNEIILAKASDVASNVLNLYAKVIDNDKLFVGEIIGMTKEKIEIKLIGEIIDNKFRYGIARKPAFDAKVRLLDQNELNILFGLNNYIANNSLYLGKSGIYENYPVYAKINDLFANHLVILGNSGSGKSCGTARVLQNLFYKKDANPLNSTFFIIDAYGEYRDAFSMINYVHPELQYKNYTTDMKGKDELLQIPLWLLSLDDICLLLEVSDKN